VPPAQREREREEGREGGREGERKLGSTYCLGTNRTLGSADPGLGTGAFRVGLEGRSGGGGTLSADGSLSLSLSLSGMTSAGRSCGGVGQIGVKLVEGAGRGGKRWE
jgi:hypothetical protein